MDESVIRCYTKQMLEGLKHLHDNGIVHRDIKGANCLVNEKGELKLSDFGTAKLMQYVQMRNFSEKHTQTGTPCYFAPESLLRSNFSLYVYNFLFSNFFLVKVTYGLLAAR